MSIKENLEFWIYLVLPHFPKPTCNAACPYPNYFTDNASGTCMPSATQFVTLNMSLYWKNYFHQLLVCDLTFS